MTRFQIPDVFLSSFAVISELTNDDAARIGNFLNSAPVGLSMKEFLKLFKNEFVELEAEIAQTVYSFGGILISKKAGEDIKDLAEALAYAFAEKKGDSFSDVAIANLARNLHIILENASNLEKTFKAMQLLSANANIYRDSKIFTDIRLLFEEDVESATRCGVILHQLKIEYSHNEEPKTLFICLDNEDLSGLIESLQRAIKKEESIKKNQSGINFIKL